MPDLSPELASDERSLHRKQPVSFVRRGDRMTASQQHAWDTKREQYFIEVPRDVSSTSVDLNWHFDAIVEFGRNAPLVLEVGTGRGENIVAAADREPERDFLGVEVYLPGLGQAIVRAEQCRERTGLTNLRLVQVNAVDLLATAVAPGEFDEVWVFFPDPWHKTRHHKRRLINSEFADLVARVLRPGGVWRLATDWLEYGQQMRQVLDAHRAFTPLLAEVSSDALGSSASNVPRFDRRVLTAFEKKGLAKGRVITDLAYQRV